MPFNDHKELDKPVHNFLAGTFQVWSQNKNCPSRSINYFMRDPGHDSRDRLENRPNVKAKFSNSSLSTLLVLEIKTFGLVLEFEMSYQQQQHSFAFMLLYSDLRRSLGPIFLNWDHSLNLIGPFKRFLRLLSNFDYNLFFNKLTPSCHFCRCLASSSLHEVRDQKNYAHVKT